MVINKKAIKTAILAALALLVADPLRTIPYAPHQTLLISFAMTVRYTIHVSLLIAWCISLSRRLLQKK